jgi:hypothetical protein
MWTDIGIPDTQNRDGMLNTNNWVERAFKTFDSIFLDCRANKRLDRLFIIIANEFLPFYREWEPNHKQRNTRLIKTIKNAHRTWSTQEMITQQDSNLWEVSELDTESQERDDEDDEEPLAASFVCVKREDGALTCACRSFTQTGRSCVHIWAVRMFLGNGDIAPYLGKWFSNAYIILIRFYLEHETVRAVTGNASKGHLKATQRKRSEGLRIHDKLVSRETDAILKDLETQRTFDPTDDNDDDVSINSESPTIDSEGTADDSEGDVKADVHSVFSKYRILARSLVLIFW